MFSATQPEIGPITLRPIPVERVWGSDTLPEWLPAPAKGKPIGEAWLTAGDCLIDSSASHGKSFAELIRSYPQSFAASAAAEFPLLIKLLFPQEKLSVQVHPDDALAQTLGQPRGKTECWYVLSAEHGASVMVGFAEDNITPSQVREAIASGTLEQKLRKVSVKTGDMIYIPAGTVHAIGPGMTLLETQQTSDVTYRLFDYGRPRELHIEAGLTATKVATDAGLVAPIENEGFTRLITSPYFVIDRFVTSASPAPLGKHGELQILIALDEGCFLECSSGIAVPLLTGRAVILPAEPVDYTLRSAFGSTVIRIAQK